MCEDSADWCFIIQRDTMRLWGINIAIVKSLEEGGLNFPLPSARHHLLILSTTYRQLILTPVLRTPLTVWTVEGYFTMCLISLRTVSVEQNVRTE